MKFKPFMTFGVILFLSTSAGCISGNYLRRLSKNNKVVKCEIMLDVYAFSIDLIKHGERDGDIEGIKSILTDLEIKLTDIIDNHPSLSHADKFDFNGSLLAIENALEDAKNYTAFTNEARFSEAITVKDIMLSELDTISVSISRIGCIR